MNNEEDMGATIKDIKSRIANFQSDYETKIKRTELRAMKETRLEQKLEEVKKIQGQMVEFNIGGEICQVNRCLIMNSRYENILKDVIVNLEKLGRGVDDLSSVFIDRNPKSFLYIVEIIRKRYIASQEGKFDGEMLPEHAIRLRLPKCLNFEHFKNDIHFYFKDDSEKVLSEFNIFQLSKGKEVKLMPTTSIQNKFFQYKLSSSFPNNLLDKHRATSIQDITSKASKKAVFLNYDSTLDIEFTEIILIESLDVKPFYSNEDIWISTEGAGAFIFTSYDKQDWDFLGVIPEEYGWIKNSVSHVLCDSRMAKYLRFQTGDYTLSISYLKVN